MRELSRTATLVTRHPRRVIVVGVLLAAVFAVLGSGVSHRLKAGGFDDAGSDSVRASALLARDFHVVEGNAAVLVSSHSGSVDSPAVAAGGRALTAKLAATRGITVLGSYWTAPASAKAALRSKDGTRALVSLSVAGDDDTRNATMSRLDKEFATTAGAASVQFGGLIQGNTDTTAQINSDLATSEGIAIPVTLLLLILVFGSVVAGFLPLIVGGSAIVGTLASLWALTYVTDVSIYALNLTTAMGLGLGLDYALLVVSRYREELALGHTREAAVVTTLRTAGRTIAFSAATVGVALAALLVFPLYFLRSFAYAAAVVVVVSAAAALILLPAVLIALGPRVDALSLPWKRNRPVATESAFWARLARLVMRRPVAVALPVVGLLLLLGIPFLHVQVGRPDDRVLPKTAQARMVGDALRSDFDVQGASVLNVLFTDHADAIDSYARQASTLPGVAEVVGVHATYAAGRAVTAVTATTPLGDEAYVTVVPTVSSNSPAAQHLVRELRSLPAPTHPLVTGEAASLVDSVHAVTSRLPLALGLIALATFVLLFLFTGSVVLPLKALLLNVISLSAVMGILVFVFQDGHFASLLGFTPTPLAVAIPLLVFCVAFGLSMDYEVFLLGRIAEQHHAGADTVTAVSTGLARTGRIVTTAAAVLSLTFFSFVASKVSFIQLFGLGCGVAIVIDATLVRGLLVPAFMRLMGGANWWAPAPLRRLHARFGLSEGEPAGGAEPSVGRGQRLRTAGVGDARA